MPVIKIGDRLVGDGKPTYIIAEIGINHNGILPLALELIDVAVSAGADAVKFQKRSLDHLYGKKYLENANSGEKTLRYLLPILQTVELPDSAYFQITDYCRKKGITFLCSAFDPPSADFLDQLGVPAFKVASADLTNLPLLEHGRLPATDRLYWHVAHGKSRRQLRFKERARVCPAHCNSTYPTAFEDVNLLHGSVPQFGVPVGYSGHERGIAVSTVASVMGASIIGHITWTGR
jgi:N-acetylneuraminate synthase